MLFKNKLGQALIEYLFIFAFMGMTSVAMVRGFGVAFYTSVGSLNYFLTHELSTGTCESSCMGDSYENLIK